MIMMKKLTLFAMLVWGMCMSASAERILLFTLDIESGMSRMQFWIDREAMFFYYDSDSEDDAKMQIKNYKKNGNKETFDIYQTSTGEKWGRVEIVIDPTLEIKQGMDLTKQTMYLKTKYEDQKFAILHGQKQYDEYYEKSGRGGDDVKDEIQKKNPLNKAKDKAKGLLNKGKNLFKKK